MKTRHLQFLIVPLLIVNACTDREDYFASSKRKVNVALESPLTACTSSYPGFINLDYAFNFTLSPEYSKANPFPLIAQYTCENAGSFELSKGNKRYSPNDTIMFNALSKKMMLNVSKPGTYRFLIQFYKENRKDEILGKYELTFVIGTPDLNMYIVRDGRRVENLEETENFLEFEGSFIVRVNSEKEELNKGRLTLTTNIIGSSVRIKNWQDRETKISQSDDLAQSVDFLVEYKNIQIGKTKFVFTAQSQNSSAVLRDSMNIQESRPGSLHLNTAYHQEKKYFSREQLWAGQTDSVEYLITPDPKAISDLYKIKFEMSDPAGLWLFNTGNPEKQKADRQYEPNKWYDFSDRKNGKLYYVFPSPTAFADTIFISLQNGETSPIRKYKLFVSCKQSSDYTFDVTFQPVLVDGFDEIRFSDLLNKAALHPVVLSVQDENPFAQFDYLFSWAGMNPIQSNIIQQYFANSVYARVDYQQYLGSRLGYLTGSKFFNVSCYNNPLENEASAYSANTFEWIYKTKRLSDGMEKTVSRKIRIINDLLKFRINLSSASREYVYQNEPLNIYQLIYDTPSKNSDDYSLQVSTTHPDIADVYVLQKDMSFKKADFESTAFAPATHSTSGTMLGDAISGMIRIKGKKPGTAQISFLLRHKTSGATQTITKTVETKTDPVQYSIVEGPESDFYGNPVPASKFNQIIHSYRFPGYSLTFHKNSLYEGNTAKNVMVKFDRTGFLDFTVSGGIYANQKLQHGVEYEFEYDKAYIITLSEEGSTRNSIIPWKRFDSAFGQDITVRKAIDQETPITAQISAVRYKIGDYKPLTNVKGKIMMFSFFYNHAPDILDYVSPEESYNGLGEWSDMQYILSLHKFGFFGILIPITPVSVSLQWTAASNQDNAYIRDIQAAWSFRITGDTPQTANYFIIIDTDKVIRDNWGYYYETLQTDFMIPKYYPLK